MATQSLLIEKSAPVVPLVNSRKIAILGFGTVGKSVARILSEGRVAGLELSQACSMDEPRGSVDGEHRRCARE